MSEKKEEKEIIAKNEAVESKTKESKKTKISSEDKEKINIIIKKKTYVFQKKQMFFNLQFIIKEKLDNSI